MKKVALLAKSLFFTAALFVSTSAMAAVDYTSVTPEPGEYDVISDGFTFTYPQEITAFDDSKIFLVESESNEQQPLRVSKSRDNKKLYVTPFLDGDVVELDKAGSYMLFIYSEAITFGDEYNSEVELFYTITEKSNPDVPGPEDPQDPEECVMVVTPKPGEVEYVGDWALSFTGEWALGNRSLKFVVTGPDGVTIPSINSYSNGTEYLVYFSNDKHLTEPGTYTLTVPAGKFLLGGEGTPNEETVYEYVIPGPNDAKSLINVDPAPGEVTAVGEWTLTFADEWYLADRSAKFTVTGPEGVSLPKVYSTSLGTAFSVYFEDEVMLTDPGKYILTIPAGKFGISTDEGDVLNPEMNLEYIIPDNNIYAGLVEVTPAPGSEIQQFDKVVLTFDGENVEVCNSALITLRTPDGRADCTVTADGNKLTVALNSNILFKAGYYNLKLALGAVKIDGSSNPELDYSWHIQMNYWNGTFSADPTEGSVLNGIHDVDVTFEGAKSVVVDEFPKPNDFPMLYDVNLNTVVARGRAFAEKNLLQVMLDTEVTAPGEYLLMVPQSFFTVDGQYVNGGLSLPYTIEKPADAMEYTYTLNPADGASITNDTTFEITFAAEGLVSVTKDAFAWGASAPHFESADGYYCPSLQIVDLSDFTFRWSHTYPLEDYGKYSFVIPSGYFTLTDTNGQSTYNDAIKVTYSFSKSDAIDALAVDAVGSYEVYNVLGVCVLRNASASQVKSLAPGVYVINGKKCLVK